jgi:hypothetical protein
MQGLTGDKQGKQSNKQIRIKIREVGARKDVRYDVGLPFRPCLTAPGLCYPGERRGLCSDRFLFRISSMRGISEDVTTEQNMCEY